MDSLKSAKHDKTSLSAIWLDVANAYGSVPHRLIYFALKHYGVSEKWIKIIQQYYGGIWSKYFQEFSPSSWHHHQRGILIGCAVSIVLFLAAINVIIAFYFVIARFLYPRTSFRDESIHGWSFCYVFFGQRNSTFIKSLHSSFDLGWYVFSSRKISLHSHWWWSGKKCHSIYCESSKFRRISSDSINSNSNCAFLRSYLCFSFW